MLERPSLSDALVDSSRIHNCWKRKIKCFDRTASEMDSAVLVDVGQLINVPKGTVCALPCRERLERLDERCRLITDPFQHIEAVSLKFGDVIKNGELSPGVVGGGIVRSMDDKLIHKVVECRTDVVDYFSDDNAPHRWTWFFHEHSDGEVYDARSLPCPAHAAELEGRFIGISLKETGHFLLERIDLLVGPLQFQADASDGGEHRPLP